MKRISAFEDGAWHGKIEAGGQFPPEKGRYHLYIGYFCPYAHRVNLIRHLKGLTEILPVSIVRPFLSHTQQQTGTGFPGWKFAIPTDPYEGSTEDHIFSSEYLHEVYFRDKKDYTGRFSVPVLWDKKQGVIVNNESLEILRNLNDGFNSILEEKYANLDFYPVDMRRRIDGIGSWVQTELNKGVYFPGFAQTQEAYNAAVIPVFEALNKLETIIHENGGPYILGDRLSEIDLRVFPTIVRFDATYVQNFKCNLGMIRHDYPVINEWLKNLFWNVEGFAETTEWRHIKEGYSKSFPKINPLMITPMGPVPNVEKNVRLDWENIKPGGVKLPSKSSVEE